MIASTALDTRSHHPVVISRVIDRKNRPKMVATVIRKLALGDNFQSNTKSASMIPIRMALVGPWGIGRIVSA